MVNPHQDIHHGDHIHIHGVPGKLPVNLSEVDLSKLTEREKWRVEQAQVREKHKGHEKMHLEMLLVLISTLAVAQVILIQWKQRHFRSYQLVTSLGMWAIPVFFCLKFWWMRFLVIWIVYSVVTGFIVFRASQPVLGCSTPRLVYKWFLFIYKMSYATGIIGYIIVLFSLFHLNALILVSTPTAIDAGVLLLFYGMYYGVLCRDIAEICSDRMASKIGYYSPDGFPSKAMDEKTCGICGNPMVRIIDDVGDEEVVERTYRLSCDHVFHEFCIRGWCIVGKKQICPLCKEKVDLKRMFPNPWDKPHLLYGNLLNWIRYLVAWQPLIITIVQGINWTLGLE